MTKKSRQGLRRLRVEVRSWGNYIEQVAELKRVLAKKPRTLQIEVIGTGEIPADSALRFRAALMERSPRTKLVTHAHSTLQGGSVLLWLLGDGRTIRDDARLYFRRTTLSENDEVQVNGACEDAEPAYRDSYSTLDPDEGDYARVLQIIDEYLPVREMAGRLIGVPVLRQFGLIENEKVDSFLATVFSKCPGTVESTSNARNKWRAQRRDKTRVRSMRKKPWFKDARRQTTVPGGDESLRRHSPRCIIHSTFECPVGRAAQPAVCKTVQVGATPARDSNFIFRA